MKPSRLFLSVGSAILAIVGIAATKAHQMTFSYKAIVTYTGGARVCVLGTIPFGCTNTGVNQCFITFHYTISGRLYTALDTGIYTRIKKPNCITHLNSTLE